jgi:hypothetical protein
MRKLALLPSVGIILALLSSGVLRASEIIGLTGIFSSGSEGPMEGVLVS